MASSDSPKRSEEMKKLEDSSAAPERGREVLVMTVQLGEGQEDTISVHEHDEPSDLAVAFGQKHSLPQRLYSALTKTIESNIQQLVLEQESSPQTDEHATNIGEILYEKGRKMKENAKERVLEMMQKREIEEQKELTFKPTIISGARPRHGNPEKDLLLRYKQTKEVLEQRKQDLLKEEATPCTFTPQINSKSKRLASAKSPTNKFEELYQEAKERKTRKETTSEAIYTFRPELVAQHKSVERDEDIFERLYAVAKEENPLETDRNEEITADPVTGQPLFRPMTGRPPKIDVTATQRRRDLPIGEYLYSYKKSDTFIPRLSHQPTHYSRLKSESLLRRRKEEKFRELFLSLKPLDAPSLSPENIQLEGLSEDLIKVLNPLLFELESVSEGLEFDEFATAMDNLMKTLNPEERALLLDISKKREQHVEPSFHVRLQTARDEHWKGEEA